MTISNLGQAASSEVLALADGARDALNEARTVVTSIVLGKSEQVDLALAAMLAGGHVLIEDLPGVGKTTLARAIAKVSGLEFRRIQFTSDMLPADVVGVSVYDSRAGKFDFHPGPLFAQVVVADEINRGTPKTQSALLEAMAEGQVTVDGDTLALPQPFLVLATQNPVDLAGTFPLPDSQLDRFMLRLHLGYPDPRAERELFQGGDPRDRIDAVEPSLSAAQIMALRNLTIQVHVSDPLTEYALRLVEATREHPDVAVGLSPRAGIALLRAARAVAVLQDRDHARPADIQTVFGPLAAHRLQSDVAGAEQQRELADTILEQTPIP